MIKVCVVAHDPIQKAMAGPGIRSLELARALAKNFDVTFATPNPVDLPGESFKTVYYNYRSLKKIVEDQDVVCVFGFQIRRFPFLKKIAAALVVDVYCPTFFEALASYQEQTLDEMVPLCRVVLDIFQEQLQIGDFFICAGEKQRDMWVGMLMATGRINPYTFAMDNTLRKLIDVVPYGLPGHPPEKNQGALKGAHPAIKKDDFVLLWGGGLYDWLDPLVAVRAMEIVGRKRQDVKLFFMGCRHPLASVEMDVIKETRRLSEALGLTGKTVLFNDHWVAYQDRANYLLDADIGLNLHKKSIETDYSFRTRIMDYLWAELPILTTRGGTLADLVEEKNLGCSVDYDDAEGLAEKILDLADGRIPLGAFRENIRRVKGDYSWERVVEPLEEFCRSPFKRIDRNFAVETWSIRSPFYFYRAARSIYKTKGMAGLTVKVVLFFLMRIQIFLANLSHRLVGAVDKNTSS